MQKESYMYNTYNSVKCILLIFSNKKFALLILYTFITRKEYDNFDTFLCALKDKKVFDEYI